MVPAAAEDVGAADEVGEAAVDVGAAVCGMGIKSEFGRYGWHGTYGRRSRRSAGRATAGAAVQRGPWDGVRRLRLGSVAVDVDDDCAVVLRVSRCR